MNPYQDFSNPPQQQQQQQQQPNAPLPGGPQVLDPAGMMPNPTPVAPGPVPLLVPKKSKLPLILAVVAGVELLIIAGLLVVVANTKTPTTAKSTSNSTQSQAPQPATSVSTQQTNDAISQSLSSVSNDRDLPTDKLSDKNLGL